MYLSARHLSACLFHVSARGASKAAAAHGRVDRVRIEGHDEEVADREVHLIAFARDNGSKVS